MTKYLLVLLALFFCKPSEGQVIARSTIGSFGSSSSKGNVTLQSSGGQVATENKTNGGTTIGQGAIQPVIIFQEANDLDAIVYPNPTSDMVILSFDQLQAKEISMSIVNMTGETVYNNKEVIYREKQIDLRGFKAGTYILDLKSGGMSSSFKIVIN
jgi:hypothetical protein